MKKIPLEDNSGDVVGKAQIGLKLSDADLANLAGVLTEEIVAARNGDPREAVLRKIAPLLELNADALVALARGEIAPAVPEIADGFAGFTTPYRENITVNNYLIWDPVSRGAAIFDTGSASGADELFSEIRRLHLSVRAIFLTHAHPDHIAALDEIVAETHAPVFLNEREAPVLPADLRERISAKTRITTFSEDEAFSLDKISVKTLTTSGHSPGQTTFVISGLTSPVAVVGDSIFAGSMGGSRDFFREQRANNIEKILTLPDETLLAPGHGPLTTVGFEKRHNPFFC